MRTFRVIASLVATITLMGGLLPLCGCRAAEPESAGEEAKKTADNLPLVDNMDDLKKLDPNSPMWIDKKHEALILLGEACKAGYPLEFFATLPDRAYEAVVVVTTKPSLVHAGLLALGAKPGHPVRFNADFHPPTGTEIAIEVRWKDDKGKVQSAAAQKWIRNMRTKAALDVNWVFAGSGFRKDPETGQQRYFGDSGDFISVSNLPTATLDLPINSTKTMESRLFEGALDQMPPAKTPVTIVLKPKLEGKK